MVLKTNKQQKTNKQDSQGPPFPMGAGNAVDIPSVEFCFSCQGSCTRIIRGWDMENKTFMENCANSDNVFRNFFFFLFVN